MHRNPILCVCVCVCVCVCSINLNNEVTLDPIWALSPQQTEEDKALSTLA